jgi:hypothetical protein
MNTQARLLVALTACALLTIWPIPAQSHEEQHGTAIFEFKGECGKPLTIRTDGTNCPGPNNGALLNTCASLTPGSGTAITSCATVLTFDPKFVDHHNLYSVGNALGCDQPGNPPCTIDTGYFVTLVECCTGGPPGIGVHWGEVKSCCQVKAGQSPKNCDTPCGKGGGTGCASCTSPTVGQCTNTFGPVQSHSCSEDDRNDSCPDGSTRYFERMRIRTDGDTDCRSEM